MEKIDDHIKIIREINEYATTFYKKSEKHDHSSFLEKCNVGLFSFFNEKFGESFLFSAMTKSFKRRKNKLDFEIVPGSNHISKYNFSDQVGNKIKKAVESLLEAAHKTETINLTNFLLSKQPPGQDLFFTTETNQYRHKKIVNDTSVLEFALSSLKYNKETDQANSANFTETNKVAVNDFIRLLDIEALNLSEKFSFQQYAEYLWHYKKIEQSYIEEHPDGKFFIHFIRPSVIELDYNLMLSFATNRELDAIELAFIDLLIYRIVSQTALEKVTEAEKLKFFEEQNMTVHVMKTQVQNSIQFYTEYLQNKYPNEEQAKVLNANADALFHLAGIMNLLNKTGNKEGFHVTGKQDDLLSDTFIPANYQTVLDAFNERLYSMRNIKIEVENEVDFETTPLFKLFDYYPSKILCDFFFLSIFENVGYHSVDENHKINLKIYLDNISNVICFSNKVPPSATKVNELKGNLAVYDKLLQDTSSGEIVHEISLDNFILKVKRYYA